MSIEVEKQVNPLGSTLSFLHLSYQVNAKESKGKLLIDDVSVTVKAGELLAIMGPSGAGKSTLLDLMAFRKVALDGAVVSLNGEKLNTRSMQQISTFVEQEDTLLGVLTVRESVSYALRLHLPMLSRRETAARVDRVLTALGLQSCANQQIGTPISRGVSGGQKRRVTAACAMVTFPRILLLDEVTSGLDSTSAREVMSAIRTLAVAEGMIFTNLLLLAEGQTCFSGRVDELEGFMDRWGHPVGKFELTAFNFQTTPSDHAMNFLNEDFANGTGQARGFREFYLSTLTSANAALPETAIHASRTESSFFASDSEQEHPSTSGKNATSSRSKNINTEFEREREHEYGKTDPLRTLFWNTIVLSERTAVNYSRNLLAYGVRAGMYAGMGIMLGTIWIHLGTSDSKINDRLSIHFYSVAFLAFMSVAGIPGFLEERAVYYRESKNGLYTTLPFVLSNTLVGMPFLFVCTLLFTLISYWAIGLHHGAPAFSRFLAFLYLAILVAESQILVIAALMPIFVAALAIGAFVNGFWMSVGGYFIKARSLPRFWFYSFHYMDYQRYAFELLTNSDLRGLTFSCNDDCVCAYPSSTPETCTVSGTDVLSYLDIGDIGYGKWAAILVGIFVIYRAGLYFALKARSN
ncbi:ABC transporter domain-containing protein [Mycena sanguinolenta]|uniref:ABC transporter domain-containing protein n=1 Tax=Mycena sanguinolenta TaxID=230812 RepID=A0A8H7DHU3_9AGAR|nr:ABC transporter domain-containing protein [Mycena sanguinolenta]